MTGYFPRKFVHVRWLAAVAVAAISAMPAVRAEAQQPMQTCGQRAELIKALSGKFKEQAVAAGIAENGSAVVEVFASVDGTTWTILYSLPSGVSCLLATGLDWQHLPRVAEIGPPA